MIAGDQQQLGQLSDGVKELLTSSTWEHKIGGLMSARVSTAGMQSCTPAEELQMAPAEELGFDRHCQVYAILTSLRSCHVHMVNFDRGLVGHSSKPQCSPPSSPLSGRSHVSWR